MVYHTEVGGSYLMTLLTINSEKFARDSKWHARKGKDSGIK